MQRFFARRSGSPLTLLIATAAVFLLIPAAQAFAAPNAFVEFEGSGSGQVLPVPGEEEAAGNPEIECHWNGSEIDSGTPEAGKCETESFEEGAINILKIRGVADPGSELVGWEVIKGSPLVNLCKSEPATEVCGTNTLFGAEIKLKAKFESSGPALRKLNLSTSGTGSGGFECEDITEATAAAPCVDGDEFTEGDEVKVTPVEDTGSEFAEFNSENGGECTGTDPEGCTVTMSGERTVNARFDLEPEPFAESITGPGSLQCEDETAGGGFGACASSYPYGHTVKVKALPDTGAHQVSLSGSGSASGACSGSECSFAIHEASGAAAEFALDQETLTIGKTGSGTVQCEVNGGALGACPTSADYGSTIKLFASPDTGSELASLSGAGSAAGQCSFTAASGSCEFTLAEDSEVTVEFKLENEDAFSAAKTGSGTGTVQCEVDGGGLEACGSAPHGSTIKLLASPEPGSELASLSGAGSAAGECSFTAASGSCEFTLEEASSVTVGFDLEPEPFAESATGPGSLQCEDETAGGGFGACASSYPYGHTVKVKALPDTGAHQVSLSGSGSASASGACSGSECSFVIHEASGAAAEFALDQETLTIDKTGSGTVQCEVNGGALGACPTSADYGSTIKLLASPDTGSELASLSGAGSAAGECSFTAASGSCEFTLTADSEVTVEFNLENSSLTIAETGSGFGSVECEVDGGGLESCPTSIPNGSHGQGRGERRCGFRTGRHLGNRARHRAAPPPRCEFTLTEDSEVSVEFKLKSSLTIEESGNGFGSFQCDTGSGAEAVQGELPGRRDGHCHRHPRRKLGLHELERRMRRRQRQPLRSRPRRRQDRRGRLHAEESGAERRQGRHRYGHGGQLPGRDLLRRGLLALLRLRDRGHPHRLPRLDLRLNRLERLRRSARRPVQGEVDRRQECHGDLHAAYEGADVWKRSARARARSPATAAPAPPATPKAPRSPCTPTPTLGPPSSAGRAPAARAAATASSPWAATPRWPRPSKPTPPPPRRRPAATRASARPAPSPPAAPSGSAAAPSACAAMRGSSPATATAARPGACAARPSGSQGRPITSPAGRSAAAPVAREATHDRSLDHTQAFPRRCTARHGPRGSCRPTASPIERSSIMHAPNPVVRWVRPAVQSPVGWSAGSYCKEIDSETHCKAKRLGRPSATGPVAGHGRGLPSRARGPGLRRTQRLRRIRRQRLGRSASRPRRRGSRRESGNRMPLERQ